jgi:hypothetical protein
MPPELCSETVRSRAIGALGIKTLGERRALACKSPLQLNQSVPEIAIRRETSKEDRVFPVCGPLALLGFQETIQMAVIKGHLAAAPEQQEPRREGASAYFTFRLAENAGRQGKRKTVWFDVVASISPQEATRFVAGQAIAVEGRLEPSAYLKKRDLARVPVPTTWEGVDAVLKEKEALGVGLKLLTRDVRSHTFVRRTPTNEDAGSAAPGVNIR